jgi:uncharacterized protein (TIGR03435 family)
MLNGAPTVKLRLVCCSVIALIAYCRVGVRAQDSVEPKFDIASIKPNKSDDARGSIGAQPGGRFLAINMPVRDLVSFAYQVQTHGVVGGPEWLTSDRFDIVATAEAGIPVVPPSAGGPPSTMQLMMRALLADRFGLSVHNETREMPIYNMVIASGDGALGNKLRRSSADCREVVPTRAGTPQPPNQAQRATCGMRLGPGMMSAEGRSATQLANTLGQFVQRPVVNRTGLEGLFDFDLLWAYEAPIDASPAARVAPIDPNAPSIFTAVQEQLGLKLESGQAPLDVVVIDHVEPPTPN